jgi:hypothetical protein
MVSILAILVASNLRGFGIRLKYDASESCSDPKPEKGLEMSGKRARDVRGSLEARNGTILNVGLLNLVPVTGRLGRVSRRILQDT